MMRRNVSCFLCFMAMLLVIGASTMTMAVAATTKDEQFDKVKTLIDQGRDLEAVDLLKRLYDDYPDDASAPLNLGLFYSRRQDFAQSVGHYEEALRRLQQDPTTPRDALGPIHYQLVNDYNELGQQRYFSPDLCLRILYHLEQAWPHLSQSATQEDMHHHIEFARKTVGHYEVASMGPNVRMKETSDPNQLSSAASEDAETELVLHPDGIDETVKLQAKEAIAARVLAFDAAQPPEYELAPSDRSVEEILQALDSAFTRVSSLHYSKYQQHEGAEELVEETWYRYPRLLKTRQRRDGQEAWFLIRDGRLTAFDPARQRLLSEEETGDEPGWLMEIRKPHAGYLRQYYDLTVQKLARPPVFLDSLYREQPATLYLVTGLSKDPDGVGWPPIVKAQYTIDVDRGLLVGLREYWHGIVGSGRQEELAVTDVVTHWMTTPGGIVLPTMGRREQLVDESPGHRIDRTTWRIEYQQVNEALASGEFDLTGYAHEAAAGSNAVIAR